MSLTPQASEVTSESAYDALVSWLSKSESYPERPASVRRVETHISCVFLTDQFAYKLKKPVQFEFLDFSTLELRRRACEEEIRLNRRLAPDVYLGLVAVQQSAAGRFALEESCKPENSDAFEWLVKMRRLPGDATLAARIKAGLANETDAEAISNRLAEFYRSLPALPINESRYREEIIGHVQANRTELLRSHADINNSRVKRIHGAQLRLLRLQPELFDARIKAGRVIDGHGDLRPEHIYLEAEANCELETSIIDCIEFNAEFRHLDVADEMGFLATECDFAGDERLGEQIFRRTLKALDDDPPRELIAFYRSYRACVRAKVAVLRAAQLTGELQAAALAEANRHLSWADRYDKQLPPPILLVMSGLMGSGKSTLANELAANLGSEILSTDVIRRDILGASAAPAAYGSGHYALEDRKRVYEEMLTRAAALLDEGLSVLLDGAFPSNELRSAAIQIARQRELQVHIVHCCCADEVARQRIRARLVAGTGVSEARPDLYEQQKEEEEPFADTLAVEINTEVSLAEQIATVIAAIARR